MECFKNDSGFVSKTSPNTLFGSFPVTSSEICLIFSGIPLENTSLNPLKLPPVIAFKKVFRDSFANLL